MRGTFNGQMPMYGAGMSVFHGFPHQRGHGIGGIFKGLLRMIIPMAQRAGKTIGKQALRAAAHVAEDVAEGQSLEGAVKRRAAQAIRKVAKRRPRRKSQKGRGLGVRKGAKVGKPIYSRGRKRRATKTKRQGRRKLPVDVFA